MLPVPSLHCSEQRRIDRFVELTLPTLDSDQVVAMPVDIQKIKAAARTADRPCHLLLSKFPGLLKFVLKFRTCCYMAFNDILHPGHLRT